MVVERHIVRGCSGIARAVGDDPDQRLVGGDLAGGARSRWIRLCPADQHPDLADRPIVVGPNGWDNALFRLGGDLVVRLPRRQLSARLVEHELRWLPELGPSLPLPVPVPVRAGRPAEGFPWCWSVGPWFAGAAAAYAPLTDPS